MFYVKSKKLIQILSYIYFLFSKRVGSFIIQQMTNFESTASKSKASCFTYVCLSWPVKIAMLVPVLIFYVHVNVCHGGWDHAYFCVCYVWVNSSNSIGKNQHLRFLYV